MESVWVAIGRAGQHTQYRSAGRLHEGYMQLVGESQRWKGVDSFGPVASGHRRRRRGKVVQCWCSTSLFRSRHQLEGKTLAANGSLVSTFEKVERETAVQIELEGLYVLYLTVTQGNVL